VQNDEDVWGELATQLLHWLLDLGAQVLSILILSVCCSFSQTTISESETCDAGSGSRLFYQGA